MDINTSVGSKINELISEFNNFPDKFLTEEDVRGYLYHLLLRDFGEYQSTKNQTVSIAIHNEVRWYGDNNKLKYRSDIVLVDVGALITQEKTGLRLPSKGYMFNKFNALIELKLRRINGKSDKQFLKDIRAERRKINKLHRELEDGICNFISFLIVFDKKNNLEFSCRNDDFAKEFYIFCDA
ncbi:MAG: hypothetical protein LHV68_05575 [Elusimicrobia bacterium]|nr:hypothetical protein [Candidatus Liberimonas magnetica]